MTTTTIAVPGERMREMRLSRGLTLEQMGQIMGISASAVSQIERGITKNVRPENFLRFCAYFDADPYYVVFGKPKAELRDILRRRRA
jgi:transcriptional regulator with XRE-family HTH domain